MNRINKFAATFVLLALISSLAFSTAADKNSANGRGTVKADDLKEWLGYLASDELEGRNTFSEGLGIAAAYIAGQLKSWGVKPGGTNGSYYQRVAVLGVKSDNQSTLTVEVNGESRTFKNKEGINFPANVGGKRTFTADQIEFIGYGINAPNTSYNDFAGKDLRGKVAVWMSQTGPKAMTGSARRVLFGRSREAITQGAIASIGVQGNFPGGGQAPQNAQANPDAPDFTIAEKLDKPVPPAVSVNDEFYEFLLSAADVKYADLKDKAAKGEPLPSFTLKNVKFTFNLDADYRIVRTQYTRNVVGIIEGTDAKLKDTYVAFGAHYDHVGYSEAEIKQTEKGARLARGQGRITEGAGADRIWNGADDDGSGTVGILGVAKAFATTAKPKRSVIFVWHSGEEKGLWGSRYYVDFPTVPVEKIVAQVNIDMIGRNRDNKSEETSTVYCVGSDRISTQFHNLTVDANKALSKPLNLNYEFNDPADPEQIYYRSDHYSYAAKGVPIIFLTTGLHPDYHANTDAPEKIEYEKMANIAQYAYEIGRMVANNDKAPMRDNKGPRVGKGSSGKL
ncbi:MAG: M28 family peptidase [Acidobacteriota bacterium]